MKPRPTSLVVCALLAAATATRGASVDVQARLRVEDRENNFDFLSATRSVTDDTWLLTRVRVGVTEKFSDGVSLRGEVQDAREFFSDRGRVPYIAGSEGDDPADIRQLYVEFKESDFSLRVGRQAIALGDERLVGPLEWNNFSRTFDAVRVTLPHVGAGFDLFAASVVRVQPSAQTGWHGNRSSFDDVFFGAYGRFNPAEAVKIEPYFFYRDKNTDTLYSLPGVGTARPYDIPQRIATLGLSWNFGPAKRFGSWDFDGNFAVQSGKARARLGTAYPGTAWLDHRAWALHTGLGYGFTGAGVPLRVYGEFNYATGDKDPNDATDQSFLNLFPTNHKFYGVMDAFAWKNLREFAVTFSGAFGKRWKARVEQHAFALANTNDTWFRANAVTAVRPLSAAARTASRTAGDETDFVGTFTVNPHVTLEVGGSYFSAGRYLAQTGTANDARFIYLQSLFSW